MLLHLHLAHKQLPMRRSGKCSSQLLAIVHLQVGLLPEHLRGLLRTPGERPDLVPPLRVHRHSMLETGMLRNPVNMSRLRMHGHTALETGMMRAAVKMVRRLHCRAAPHLQQLCCDQLPDAAGCAGNQHCVAFCLHTGVRRQLSGCR
jgi:hypothetical protein